MTAQDLITSGPPSVNQELSRTLRNALATLLNQEAAGASARELEVAVWQELLLPLGQAAYAALLAVRCLHVTQREMEGRDVSFRLDNSYTLSQTTTFGTVHVPLFAYRDGPTTKTPARVEVFPQHPKCRSSELLLEWEARLGSSMPFRQAEEAMEFYSHGAARIEDNTINRHMQVVASLFDHSWTCRTPEQIAELLQQATRDKKTRKPLLYVSSDAHALRRYVDDTWNAEYKMINGIRLWCVSRSTGKTIHLGGAYTWGDCREVATLLESIMDHALPTVEAKRACQAVFVADGIGWIRDHLHPKMPKGTRFILDFYHLLEHLSKYAASRFGPKSASAKRWVAQAAALLTGKRGDRPSAKKTPKKRKGHRKQKREQQVQKGDVHQASDERGAAEQLLWQLIEEEDDSEAMEALIHYVASNTDRADYPAYRARGMQIGSGAMESFHRVASQMRLKVAGARWTEQSAIAVLNTRLLQLAGRWADFWGQDDLSSQLRSAFMNPAVLSL